MSAIKSDGCSIPIDSLMQPFAIGRGEADMAGIGYAPCRTTVAEDIERGIDSLSDGQQSLFYFALAAAVFDLEWKAVAKLIKGFHADALRVPALSIFAIEEPETVYRLTICRESSARSGR
jgi:hypothetical protein